MSDNLVLFSYRYQMLRQMMVRINGQQVMANRLTIIVTLPLVGDNPEKSRSSTLIPELFAHREDREMFFFSLFKDPLAKCAHLPGRHRSEDCFTHESRPM